MSPGTEAVEGFLFAEWCAT